MKSYLILLISSAVCLLVCTVSPGIAGSRSGTTMQLTSPSSYTKTGIASWSSGGAGVASEGMFTGITSNPALLRPDHTSLYAEFGFRPSTTWAFDIGYDGQFILPACITFSIPEDGWNLSFGYANFFDSRYFIDDIAITTSELPEGTGDIFSFQKRTISHTLFSTVSFAAANDFSLGATIGLNYLRTHEELGDIFSEGDGIGGLITLGGVLRATPDVNIGAKFTLALTTSAEIQFMNSSSPVLLPDSQMFYRLPPESYIYTLPSPWTGEIGFAWNISPETELLGSLEYQHWSGVSESYDNMVQIHAGTTIHISPDAALRFGIFTQTDPSPTNQQYLNQIFLTAGTEFPLSEQWSVSASILDSHFLSTSEPSFYGSDTKFRQTLVSIGIGYSFL